MGGPDRSRSLGTQRVRVHWRRERRSAPRVFWGRSRGDRATFRLAIENAVLRFDLTVDGDTLSGTMVRSETA